MGLGTEVLSEIEKQRGAMAHHWAMHPLLVNDKTVFLGAPMHLVTMEDTLALAVEAMRMKISLHHCVVNVAKIVTMQTDEELRRDVVGADVINIDGTGVVWGARLLGERVPERVAGVEIMTRLFGECEKNGFRPFLLGATEEVLSEVCKQLAVNHPDLTVAGTQHGYFEPAEEQSIVDAINASDADCVYVAMPTPRKERFLHRNRGKLLPSFVMGVGGSFDVYAGKVKRAPHWVQRLGLEWLFRISQEPRRLWRRYYTTNTRYAVLLWRAYWRKTG